MSNFFLYTLSALERFLSATILTAIIAVSRLLFIVPFIIASVITLNQAVWAQALSLLLSMILGYFLVKPRILSAGTVKGDSKTLLKFSSFVGLARTLTAISSRLDVLMLISLTNASDTGLYSMASKVASLYPLMNGSFQTVVGPRVSLISDYIELKRYMNKIIFVTLGLIITILIQMLFANPIMAILFSDKNASSATILRLLLVSMILFTGSTPSVVLALYYLHKPVILTINSIMQLVIVFFGNLYFIPIYGRTGATYSLILAYGSSFILTTSMCVFFMKNKDI